MLAVQLDMMNKAIICNDRRTRPVEYRILRQRMIEESIERIDEIVIEHMKADQSREGSDESKAFSGGGSSVDLADMDKEAATPKRTFHDPSTSHWPHGEPVKPHPGFTPPGMERVTDDEFEVPEGHTERSKDNTP